MTTVHADFANDVRLWLLTLLTRDGVPVRQEDQGDPHRVAVAYFNVTNKTIRPRPRQVLHSQELRARALPEAVANGVRLLETMALAGTSLEAYHSVRARRPHTHDWLLNDWGIHHLHLQPDGAGDELLFVWADDDVLRFLDVLDHGAMAEIALLEIVLANWPDMLVAMPGMKGATNPEELDEARRAGVQVLVTLSDGKAYYPRGGGVTSAQGSSARASSQADYLLGRAWHCEQHFRQHADRLAAEASCSELHLQYDLAGNRVVDHAARFEWTIDQ